MNQLREIVAAEGEAIAPALAPTPGDQVLGRLVAAARGGADGDEYALIVESVLEGYLLHYGRSRLLDTADEDLRLLAGDYMYALGLSRLAQLGDLPAIRALADLITLSARQHAGALPDGDRLAALWVVTALAVGGGRWAGYEAAVEQAREGAATAGALQAEVSARATESGVELEAQHALIAFREAAATAPPR
jgi:hypothetical protein